MRHKRKQARRRLIYILFIVLFVLGLYYSRKHAERKSYLRLLPFASEENSENIQSPAPNEEETILTDTQTHPEQPNPEEEPMKADKASNFTTEEINDEIKSRINGLSYAADCTVPYEELRYVQVLHIDFDGETRTGELICNKAIAEDLTEIFYQLYLADYPIEKIRLIDDYNADDELSMADNNSSCFNFRTIAGSSTLSYHARGLAIDINPLYNPYVTYPGGTESVAPANATPYTDRATEFPYKIDENDLAYKLFTEHGFTWGGAWNSSKDYQHFQKSI